MTKPFINPLNYTFNPLNLPLPNGISKYNNVNHSDLEDIELEIMIAFQSKSYTSLKDLLPASPPSTASPTSARKDSWREIPIKDPLLQHAAWAYLLPMESTHDDDSNTWWRKFKENCGGLFGCVNGVVFAFFKDWFPEHDDMNIDEDGRRRFDRGEEC